MKNIFKFTVIMFTTLVVIFSCSENTDLIDTEFNNLKKLELNQKIELKETSTNISNNFFNIGVTKIVVKNTSKHISYKAKTQKTFYMNGEIIDLSNYNVILEGNSLYLENDNSIKLSIYQGKPYVISNSYMGFPKERDFSNKKFNILLLFMKEIVTKNEFKLNASIQKTNLNKEGCSFWNTYYIYGTGGSQSVAEANLTSEIALYTESGGPLEGCTSIGNSNSGCLWEEYGCVATQAYCCN